MTTREYINWQLTKAKEKHPEFPENLAEALSIITEELGELAEAINDKQSKERMREEAAHVAVTAIRFLEMLEKKMSNHGYPASSIECQYDEAEVRKFSNAIDRMYKNLWMDLLQRCPLDKTTPLAILNVSQSYFSVARFLGGIMYQNKHYIYEPVVDALIRSDVYKWGKKEMNKPPQPEDKTPNLFEK